MPTLAACFMCGVLVWVATFKGCEPDINMGIKARNLIQECQKDLPRNQFCEITAKIKQGEN